LLKVIKSPVKIKQVKSIKGLTINKEIPFEEYVTEDVEEKIKKRINRELGGKIKKLLQDKAQQFEKQIEEERKASYEKGLQEGEEKGRKAGEEQIKDSLDTLKKVLDEISNKKSQILIDAEKTIVGLAFNIASEIVKKEINEDDEIIVNIVKDALKYAAEEGKLIIRLNPDDLKIVQEKVLFPSSKGGKNVEIIGDKSISQGGCYVETNSGEIDATLETRLKEMEKKLVESLTENA